MSLPSKELHYQQDHINDNVQANIYATCFICLPAAFIAVGLRLISRRMTVSGFGKDDLAVLFGLLFTSGFVATCIWVTILGMGKQQILMDPANTVTFVKVTLAAQILYNPAIFFTKISILLFYHRIFPSQTFRRVSWAIGAFILSYTITSSLVNLLQCVPIAANWDPTLAATAKCVDFGSELIALSTINAVTDFILLILPIPLLWRLHVSVHKKVQLIGMFSLGTATVVISIIRANYVSTISFTNGTWQNSFGAIWSVVETCLAIVCACLPTLRPLCKTVFGKTKFNTIGSSSGQLANTRPWQIGGTDSGFEMRALGSGSAGSSNPVKGSVTESSYKEGTVHSLTRLKEDI